MLKLCRVTKVKVLFLVLVYVFDFNLFEFSAAILEKGLLELTCLQGPIPGSYLPSLLKCYFSEAPRGDTDDVLVLYEQQAMPYQVGETP